MRLFFDKRKMKIFLYFITIIGIILYPLLLLGETSIYEPRWKILVYPLINNSNNSNLYWISGGLTAYFSYSLDKFQEIEVIPISSLYKLLVESENFNEILTEEDKIKKIGIKAQADIVLTGEFTKIKEEVIFYIKLYFLKSGKVVSLKEAKCHSSNILKILKDINMQVIKTLSISPSDQVIETALKPPTSDSYAFLIFGRGVASYLGITDEFIRNIDAAINRLNKSLLIDYKFYQARLLLAEIYTEKNLKEKAIFQLNEALKYMPDDVNILRKLASLCKETERTHMAVEMYEKIIELIPQDPSVRLELANLYKSILEFDKAITQFIEITKLFPNFAKGFKELGTLYWIRGDDSKAVEAYEKVSKLSPQDIEVRIALAAHYLKIKDYEKAEEKYLEIKEISPSDPKVYHFLGNTYLLQNKKADALQAFYKEYKLSSDLPNPFTLFHLALLFLEQDNLDESINFLQILINRHKEFMSSQIYTNLGIAYLKKGNSKVAKDMFEKSLRIDPKNSITHYNLGVLFDSQGMFEEAILAYKKAVELDPNNVFAYYNLGIIFSKQGDNDNAISAFQNAVKKKSDFAPAYYNLGVIFESQKKYQEASLSYEMYLQYTKDNNSIVQSIKQRNSLIKRFITPLNQTPTLNN